MKTVLYIAIAGSVLSCAPALAQPEGRSGNHYNFAVAGASARASANAVAIQGQKQSQRQSQSLNNTNTSTNINNVSTGNGNGNWWNQYGGQAPSLSGTVGNGVCSSQLGLSLGFIGSFGVLVPVADDECNARADFITYTKALPHKVWNAYPAANSAAVRAAYKGAGY